MVITVHVVDIDAEMEPETDSRTVIIIMHQWLITTHEYQIYGDPFPNLLIHGIHTVHVYEPGDVKINVYFILGSKVLALIIISSSLVNI